MVAGHYFQHFHVPEVPHAISVKMIETRYIFIRMPPAPPPKERYMYIYIFDLMMMVVN